jgi:superoxide dismutase, Fe-Mn family
VTTRRQVFRILGAVPAAVAGAPFVASSLRGQAAAPAKGPFSLSPLPYAFDALEPYIDAQTMQIHHDRHHAAYVNNLNNAVAGQAELAGKTVEELVRGLESVPESVRTAVRNNGGGHVNHSFFWQVLSKSPGGRPKGELAKAIDQKFGSFDKFQEQFTKTALGVFGSGWAWLTLDPGKQLMVHGTSNQDNPWMSGHTPLLCIDVWEHAYYLKYQNRRPEYVAAFCNVINWDFASERYRKLA